MKAFLFSEINDQARPVVHPPVDTKLLETLRDKINEMEEEGNPIENGDQVRHAICKLGMMGNPIKPVKA